MVKNKVGRPESKDKRKPFNLRIKTSVLAALKKRAEKEQRPMNTVAEMILEHELK